MAPVTSRIECMAQVGTPTSTPSTPSSALVSGPIVEPHAISLRIIKFWGDTPASLQSSLKIAPLLELEQ